MEPHSPLATAIRVLATAAADPATAEADRRTLVAAVELLVARAMPAPPPAAPAPPVAAAARPHKRARPFDPAAVGPVAGGAAQQPMPAPVPVAAVPVPLPAPVPALQLAADPRWLAVDAAEWGSRAQTLALLGLWPARAHVDTRALRQLAARTLPAELRVALQGRRAQGEGPEAEEARRRRSRAQTACFDRVTALLRRVYGQQVVQWVGAG